MQTASFQGVPTHSHETNRQCFCSIRIWQREEAGLSNDTNEILLMHISTSYLDLQI